MQVQDVITVLEQLAPPAYQESYDNAGLITGNPGMHCRGILCTLDVTEAVVEEAINTGCNVIVAHHPIVFGGLKKLTGKTYVERVVIAAIKNDIAIYAIHTNLDNVLEGVNHKIADKLGLINRQILLPAANTLIKLQVFVPNDHAGEVRNALFTAGAGQIGKYADCSFSQNGTMTFTPGNNTNPYVGEPGKPEHSAETKIEVILPAHRSLAIVAAMKQVHPYEEVAYDLIPLANVTNIGSGLTGVLPQPIAESIFLKLLADNFGLQVIRHTPLLNREIATVAVCGGAGSFLIKHALAAKADIYITADVKYHEFFDAEHKMVIADIGHWESEQFTVDLLYDVLHVKFTTFAVRKSNVKTNSVNYFVNL